MISATDVALLPTNWIVFGYSFRYSGTWLGGDETMRASKFTDAQMAFTIKQDEAGITVAEIYRKAGISQATYLNWKKCYGGLMSSGYCHVWTAPVLQE
tara:strand:- start:2197 stop:2490 length:294 start_codon:yes stop_codon:yes gene_type:complete